jgi:1-acyl-sn-glycerol-3-phosphate acyltransferase
VIATVIRLATGVQARWHGCAPEPRQRIYFANHSSNLDGPVIWAALPPALRRRTRPVAAHDYWMAGPLRRWLAARFRCVLIHRHRITAETNPLLPMGAALAAGDSLIIFPEGKRAAADAEEPDLFKPGLWHLAERHPQVELVPVHLENCNRILPKGDWLPVPLIAAVTIGAPLERLPDEDRAAFLVRARAAVLALAAEPA